MTAVSDPPQALSGVTVLDLATYLAAPVCATLLGEFGADVIKVEQPGVGDDLRRLGRPVAPALRRCLAASQRTTSFLSLSAFMKIGVAERSRERFKARIATARTRKSSSNCAIC